VIFLNFLFPRYCLGCGQRGQYFCSRCLTQLQILPQICPICEQSSFSGQTHSFCQTKYGLDGLTSFYHFGGLVRQAIHKLKYRFVTDLASEFFSPLLREAEKQIGLSNFLKQYHPTVIPIPLHWRKENWRGFNQSAILGQAIAQKFDLPFSEKILLRPQAGISQTKLTTLERRKNVAKAFWVSPNHHLSIVHCLLIDDVWTTGATLKTAGNLLKHHGAQKVWALTIAR